MRTKACTVKEKLDEIYALIGDWRKGNISEFDILKEIRDITLAPGVDEVD